MSLSRAAEMMSTIIHEWDCNYVFMYVWSIVYNNGLLYIITLVNYKRLSVVFLPIDKNIKEDTILALAT